MEWFGWSAREAAGVAALAEAGIEATVGGLDGWARRRKLRLDLLPNGAEGPVPYVVAVTAADGARVGAGVGATLLEGWAAAAPEKS